jgi:hypothetical protein
VCDKFDTTGKSLLIVRNRVKPQNQKYFAFPEVKIMALIRPTRPTRGGVSRSSRCVGQGCGGRFGVRRASARRTKTSKRTAKSCGPDTRCWCQVCGKCPADDGDKTNSLTGESTKYAVKPLRRGCRSVSAALYARVRQMRNLWHTRPRVQRAPGIPCALYSKRRKRICKARAKHAART